MYGWEPGDEILISDQEDVYKRQAVVRAVTLPGHSVESVCYVVDKGGKRYLFSGDSIYLNGVLSLINCYGSTMEDVYKRQSVVSPGRSLLKKEAQHLSATV